MFYPLGLVYTHTHIHTHTHHTHTKIGSKKEKRNNRLGPNSLFRGKKKKAKMQ